MEFLTHAPREITSERLLRREIKIEISRLQQQTRERQVFFFFLFVKSEACSTRVFDVVQAEKQLCSAERAAV